MKTIDRYVLGSFLRDYAVALFALVGLYVVLDMVFTFDEWVELTDAEQGAAPLSTWGVVGQIARYYFFQSFRVFSLLAGVVPVLAASFTLMRMSRFNETSALLAAGVSLRRLAAPIVIASAGLNLVLLPLNQELVVPSVVPELTKDRGALVSDLEGTPIQAMAAGERATLYGGRYTPTGPSGRPTIERFDLLEYDMLPNGRRANAYVFAEQAVWNANDGAWDLVNGERRVSTGPDAGKPPEPVAQFKGAVTPDSIVLWRSRGQFVDLLSTHRIDQLLAMPDAIDKTDLLRVKHARLAAYVLNVFLVLLAIPCVLTREPRQLRSAAGWTFGLVGACLGFVFLTQQLAGQPPLDPQWAARWPGLMAWLPILVFGPIAAGLFERIKT